MQKHSFAILVCWSNQILTNACRKDKRGDIKCSIFHSEICWKRMRKWQEKIQAKHKYLPIVNWKKKNFKGLRFNTPMSGQHEMDDKKKTMVNGKK